MRTARTKTPSRRLGVAGTLSAVLAGCLSVALARVECGLVRAVDNVKADAALSMVIGSVQIVTKAALSLECPVR